MIVLALKATLESATGGILAVDLDRRIVISNRQFAEIVLIPDEVLARRRDVYALDFVHDMMRGPNGFRSRIEAIYAPPDATSFDVFELKDGRIIECHSLPQYLAGAVLGQVWSHRDVTARVRAEQQRDRLLVEDRRARALGAARMQPSDPAPRSPRRARRGAAPRGPPRPGQGTRSRGSRPAEPGAARPGLWPTLEICGTFISEGARAMG
ncbi:PAS-domain containing protein [Sorangium sp. So ce375]|uniref:PAS-domain containing protein n=1 Tax=Sorangium sp. So ce375 TaxID=3133306 RepID=UPI003F5BD65E